MAIPFTKDELSFLVHHNIDPEDVFDARGMTGKTFKVVAKKMGADFVFTSPCQKAGHRLKTRSSATCIQCNAAVIAYQRRNAAKAEGFVYIAHSEAIGLVKIGCCWPNLDKRILNLRSHAYGGARDWKLVFETHVKAMGRVEGAVHKRLLAYAAEGASYRGGEMPSELFDCTISAAIEAVEAEI